MGMRWLVLVPDIRRLRARTCLALTNLISEHQINPPPVAWVKDASRIAGRSALRYRQFCLSRH